MTAKPRQAPALPPERIPLGARIGAFFYQLYAGVMTAVGWVAEPLQRMIGAHRLPFFFVLPHLLIFGIFVLLPMLLNIYYSFTGGNNLFPQDRPFVGAQNYQRIFDCANLLDPNTCSEDRFWRGFYNTTFFVVFQVRGMVALALLTAVVLNRAVFSRSFFRSAVL